MAVLITHMMATHFCSSKLTLIKHPAKVSRQAVKCGTSYATLLVFGLSHREIPLAERMSSLCSSCTSRPDAMGKFISQGRFCLPLCI